MSTTVTIDEQEIGSMQKPGAQLASAREKLGYTQEYVAGKLHLRVRIIELLETDDYENMPEPVFIKGYLRAYARLLGMTPEPLLDIFKRIYVQKPGTRQEKALWQSRRESNKAEHAVRWLTSIFAIVVLSAIAMWWHSNKENEHVFPATVSSALPQHNQSETEIRLTDLSKMRSLLSSTGQSSEMEKQGG